MKSDEGKPTVKYIVRHEKDAVMTIITTRWRGEEEGDETNSLRGGGAKKRDTKRTKHKGNHQANHSNPDTAEQDGTFDQVDAHMAFRKLQGR